MIQKNAGGLVKSEPKMVAEADALQPRQPAHAAPNAAPQPSTASFSSAPSHEDVGQGGTAAAAPAVACKHGTVGYCETCALVDIPEEGDAAPSGTPETDAALERFAAEGAFCIFPLMRNMESERNRLREELAKQHMLTMFNKGEAEKQYERAEKAKSELATLQKRLHDAEKDVQKHAVKEQEYANKLSELEAKGKP